MKIKKLKLPDGGFFDLQTPDEFGNSGISCLGTTTRSARNTMLIVGTVAGAMAGFLIILGALAFGEAVENR